jgi:FlaG/FlaF family flagellin (archaellin)
VWFKGEETMRKITKLQRCNSAISPIIAVLLLISIAVVASLVVYAWVTGFVEDKADTMGEAVEVPNYAKDDGSGNLILYVQNVGQGSVDLKADSSVYINGTLYRIIKSPVGTDATDLIAISDDQAIEILTNYPYKEKDLLTIKIVTYDGKTCDDSFTTRTVVDHVSVQHKVSFTQTGSASAPSLTYSINSGASQQATVPFSVMVNEGSTISYTYQSTVSGETGTRYMLTNDPGTQQTMGTSDITVAGTYKTQYQVTFAINPVDSGTTNPSGSSNWYDAGQTGISISVSTNTGYIFYSWSANPTSAITIANPSSAATTITVNGPATVTAKMPILQTLVLTPNGPVCTSLKPVGDSPNYKCVDETIADNDATYLYRDSTSYSDEKFTLTDHGTANGNIVSVQIFMVCEKAGSGSQNSYAKTIIRLNGAITYGSETTLTGSYQQYSSTPYTTMPGTSSAWTWQNIDNLEAGISLKSGQTSGSSTSIARCTQVYAVVTYYTP